MFSGTRSTQASGSRKTHSDEIESHHRCLRVATALGRAIDDAEHTQKEEGRPNYSEVARADIDHRLGPWSRNEDRHDWAGEDEREGTDDHERDGDDFGTEEHRPSGSIDLCRPEILPHRRCRSLCETDRRKEYERVESVADAEGRDRIRAGDCDECRERGDAERAHALFGARRRANAYDLCNRLPVRGEVRKRDVDTDPTRKEQSETDERAESAGDQRRERRALDVEAGEAGEIE